MACVLHRQAAMHASATLEGLPVQGRFEIVRKIGGGGASVVFEASREGERVALKLVDLRRSAARARFSKEVWIGSMFDHPSIVSVLEVGATSALGWIAMPMLEGRTLEQAQVDPSFTFEQRVAVVDRVARGLAHVHERGVLHCDVKPSNVFLAARDQIKILDFGAALFAHEALEPRETFYGTHRYVAPERIRGEPVDRRSDVFSLGVLAFEVLSGQLPWQAENLPALLFAMCDKPPMSFRRAARASRVAIPRPMIGRLAKVIEQALATDPRKRWGSMAAFLEAWSSAGGAVVAGAARLPAGATLASQHPLRRDRPAACERSRDEVTRC
jgi:serine/threonine-protein kinase